MNQNLWCKFFNLHKYVVLKEEPIKATYSETIIGLNIISRCCNCGKIKVTKIYTRNELYS